LAKINQEEKDKTTLKLLITKLRGKVNDFKKLKQVFFLDLEFSEKNQTFTKVEGSNVDFSI